jgi:hypothetical protein
MHKARPQSLPMGLLPLGGDIVAVARSYGCEVGHETECAEIVAEGYLNELCPVGAMIGWPAGYPAVVLVSFWDLLHRDYCPKCGTADSYCYPHN